MLFRSRISHIPGGDLAPPPPPPLLPTLPTHVLPDPSIYAYPRTYEREFVECTYLPFIPGPRTGPGPGIGIGIGIGTEGSAFEIEIEMDDQDGVFDFDVV